jgi:hypothetical protein
MIDPLRFVEVRATTKSRQELIAEIAYSKALNRGFAPGQALEDWLAAEIEVDQKIGGPGYR